MQGTKERGPAADPDTIRVAIVDDHPVLRAGIRGILEDAGIQVVAEGATGREALLLCEAQQPDVLVLDYRLRGAKGTECLGPLLQRCPGTRVLIYTGLPGEGVLHAALSAGAHGFLRKSSDAAALVRAVRRVAAGENVILDPDGQRVRRSIEEGRGPLGLTPRERDVLGLVGRGMRNADIARELYVSPDTVKTHLSSAMSKLGVRDRTGAAVLALSEGIIDLTTSGEVGTVAEA
ncbi:MAG: response regulator [Nitriliruptorales bacterium]